MSALVYFLLVDSKMIDIVEDQLKSLSIETISKELISTLYNCDLFLNNSSYR